MNIKTANRLVALRKQHHMSQEMLADKLEISRQAVSKWERAEAAPDLDNLLALSEIYGVSIDELLKGVDQSEGLDEGEKEKDYAAAASGQASERAAADDYPGNGDGCAETPGPEGQPEVVRVSLSGIHVKDKDSEVHVGLRGIHVEENGGDSVHIGLGGIHVNDERYKWNRKMEALRGIIAMLITILFFVCGIAWGAWNPAWMLFLLIPIFYSLITAIYKRDASKFAYPVLTVLLFFAGGFYLSIWGIAWLVFLTIPLYYSLCSLLKK